jgi:hypothetical protein
MYVLAQHPRHVLDDGDQGLPGHYVVRFSERGGEPFDRFLTDRGYAQLLQLLDDGRRTFTTDELLSLTTPPTLEDLLATMQAESGVGG